MCNMLTLVCCALIACILMSFSNDIRIFFKRRIWCYVHGYQYREFYESIGGVRTLTACVGWAGIDENGYEHIPENYHDYF